MIERNESNGPSGDGRAANQGISAEEPTRRSFVRGTAAAALGAALGALGQPRSAHAAGSDTLRIGLIGCGGRGTSAAVNALQADSNTKLTVMADIFADRIQQSRKTLLRQPVADRIDVPDDRCFSDFDGYKKVMESDIDVVLLCTPPHFRPAHLEAAIAAGKHVFCEKPVAVDAPGVNSVLRTVELARQKNLTIVSGLCWRYDLGVLATMKRIQDGAIGELLTIQENYLTNTLWHRGREPSWSEMEYQIRNWMYFTWLSGDHIVEQHVHSLDKALWLMNDQPPARCFGLGGRQVRSGEMWGHIYDHFAVCYEWPGGQKVFSHTRQMADCFNDVEDYVVGTNGTARVLAHEVAPRGGAAWKFTGERPSMYDLEHQALFAGLRSGQILNNGIYMSFSTMLAIMGREACYSGQSITWEQAMASTTSLSPTAYAWGDVPAPTVAMPGTTKAF
ncbi:MAG: Gfo/Idh/MocA family oxidoreductase [Planctomycetes bacterium]|nr:Gfo/Idh/MocA family oxidoreductase [Planctomycetota bacterium]